MRSFFVFIAGILLSGSIVQAQPAPPCGNVHAKVRGVAISDPPNRSADQPLDQTWGIPPGQRGHGNAEGWIVTQGWPNNGGAHSHLNLQTNCTVTNPGSQPEVQVITSTKSDIASGRGSGVGASSDFDVEWMTMTNLPTGARWRMTVTGVIATNGGAAGNCTVRVNNSGEKTVPTGPFKAEFDNLSGQTDTVLKCSQGHIAIFPQNNQPTTAIATMTINAAVKFTRP